jgi:hypothetical protein
MSELLTSLIQDFRLFLLVGTAILMSCFIVLATQWNSYNLFTKMYQYIPCNVMVTTQILQPVLINVSSDIVTTTCFHTINHINELQIGAPPEINNLLWIGICIGLAMLFLAWYIHRNDN